MILELMVVTLFVVEDILKNAVTHDFIFIHNGSKRRIF